MGKNIDSKRIGNEIDVVIKGITKNRKYFVGESYNIKDSSKEKVVIINNGKMDIEEILQSECRCEIKDIKEDFVLAKIIDKRKVLGETTNGKILSIARYDADSYVYFLNGQIIGGFNPKTMSVPIVFKENTKLNDSIDSINDNALDVNTKKDITNILNKIGINEIKSTKIHYDQEYAKEMQKRLIGEKVIGKDERILRIDLIDLNDRLLDEKLINDKKRNNQELERKRINQEVNKKDIALKQEMKVNDKATDMETVGQLFKNAGKLPEVKKGENITHIAVIESDDLSKFKDENGKALKRNTTRFAMVAVTNKGNLKPLDLEIDSQEGNNPREENYTIKKDETIQKDAVQTRYKLGQGTISIDNDEKDVAEMGEISIHYSPNKTLGKNKVEGNKSRDMQLPTNNVWEADHDERKAFLGKYNTGYRDVEEGYQNVAKHEEYKEKLDTVGDSAIKSKKGEKTIGTRELDSKEKDNHEHIKFNNNQDYLENIADKVLENDKISETYNKNDTKDVIKNELEKNKDLSEQELIELVENKMENSADLEHGLPSKTNR